MGESAEREVVEIEILIKVRERRERDHEGGG